VFKGLNALLPKVCLSLQSAIQFVASVHKSQAPDRCDGA